MRRIIYIALLTSIISALLPFHFGESVVTADEPTKFKNGVYQVELNFLALEAVELGELFSKHATLIIHEGRYALSVPIRFEGGIINSITAKQQETTINSLLDRSENLVQFDMKDVKQKIVLEGTVKLSADEKPRVFSQEMVINFDSFLEREEPSISDSQQSRDLINYTLLKDGKEELSVMQTYVNPVMKIIEKDDSFYAQMEIIQSSWIKVLTVERQGKMVEPKVISQSDNTRIIEFEVEDFRKKIRLWAEVEIPQLMYSSSYFTQLQFDEKQAMKFETKVDIPELVTSNETKIPLVRRPVQSPESTRPSRKEKQSSPTVATPKEVPVEEQLLFDRTLDELKKDEKLPVRQVAEEEVKGDQIAYKPDEQVIPFNLLKVGLLFFVCILSGILLIRRIKNGKKEMVNE
ncbi:NEAT domain-containing protein [Sporosarcina aquimarina]|uniref:NEAT domain-containing protein n=1 Tax=Sporosarcina aquimarina TaxID=114975 RepID=UPI001C8D3E61|nr:NEAT domain-containing protein [Sporosarcina aquimarina]MBY0223398.1 NEAT domain-containing protein [Sporosarcina aquimarina]